MSRQDRFLESLTVARQQVLDSVDHFKGGVQSRFHDGRPGSSGSQVQPTQPNASDLSRNNTLPLYSSRNTGPQVPAQALHAAPGQSQAQVDALRAQNRRALNRSSRALDTGTPGVKTVHTYRGAGGRAVLELHTPPQFSPTYMGGSAERGRGAMVGRLSFTPKPQERVSHITLKLKAVARVRVPVVNPNAPGPAEIAGRSPSLEQTTEREVLLLQLEQLLYQASPGNKEKHFEMPPSAAHDATVCWPFRFDIPPEDKGGRAFPASYVLSGDAEARPPPKTKSSESTGAHLMQAGKGLLSSLKNVGQSAADANEWASVKWYLKVTIGRPSMFEGNDRIFVPITYLPPPPTKMYSLLDRRVRTSAQLRDNVTFGQLMESSSTWQEIGIGTARASGEKQGGLLNSLFGGGKKKVESDWTIEMPSAPAIYTLQGSIPFNICSKTEKPLGAPLIVSLFKRVTLVSKSTRASDMRKLCSARIATAPSKLVSQRTGTTTYRWQGVLDIPPSCGPCFDSQILSLEYFIGIQERIDLPCIHVEPIVLMCAPPRIIDPAVPASQAPAAAANGKVSAAKPMPSGAPVNGDERVPTASSSSKPVLPPRPGSKMGDSPTSPIASTPLAAPAVPIAGPSSYTAPATPTTPAQASAATAAVLDPEGVGRFDELNVEGMHIELPPSYFEATGIRDQD